jgi:hypothetical protein
MNKTQTKFQVTSSQVKVIGVEKSNDLNIEPKRRRKYARKKEYTS